MKSQFIFLYSLLWVISLRAQFNTLWSHSIGGDDSCSIAFLKKDEVENLYTTYRYKGSSIDIDPGAGSRILTNTNSFFEYALAKYDADGNLLWASIFHGEFDVWNMEMDKDGNVVISGPLKGTNIDFDPGASSHLLSNSSNTGSYDSFVARYTSAGILKWAFSWEGAAFELINGMDTDSYKNVYVVGYTASALLDFNPGAAVSTLGNAGYIGFIAKYDSLGNFVWVNKFENFGTAQSIAVDPSDSLIVTGTFSGTNVDFDPSGNIHYLNSAGSNDVFIAKYNSGFDLLWAYSIGGSNAEFARIVRCDNAGNIYQISTFNSATIDADPGLGSSVLTKEYLDQSFISCFNSNGNFQWGKNLFNTQYDGFYYTPFISFDVQNNLYLSGLVKGTNVDLDFTDGTNLITTSSIDFYLSKYDVAGQYQWAYTIEGTGEEGGSELAVDASGNIFVAINTLSTSLDILPGAGSQLISNTLGRETILVKYQPVINDIQEEEGNKAITLFPNPALKGQSVFLDGNFESPIVRISLQAANGAELWKAEGAVASMEQDMNATIQNIPAGMYWISITSDGQTSKFVLIQY